MSIRFRRSTRDDKRQMEFVFNQYFGKTVDGYRSEDIRFIAIQPQGAVALHDRTFSVPFPIIIFSFWICIYQ